MSLLTIHIYMHRKELTHDHCVYAEIIMPTNTTACCSRLGYMAVDVGTLQSCACTHHYGMLVCVIGSKTLCYNAGDYM